MKHPLHAPLQFVMLPVRFHVSFENSFTDFANEYDWNPRSLKAAILAAIIFRHHEASYEHTHDRVGRGIYSLPIAAYTVYFSVTPAEFIVHGFGRYDPTPTGESTDAFPLYFL